MILIFSGTNSTQSPRMQLPLKFENEYIADFLTNEEADHLYIELLEYLEEHINISLSENTFKTNFGKIMFVEDYLHHKHVFPEAIWGKTALFPESLFHIRKEVEKIVKKTFPVCVSIFYPDGDSGVGFHSDYAAFGDTSVIVSISLGAERIFQFREKESREEFSMTLKNGSLLVMGKPCQELYEHSLPEDPKCKSGRINLTFRQYGYPEVHS